MLPHGEDGGQGGQRKDCRCLEKRGRVLGTDGMDISHEGLHRPCLRAQVFPLAAGSS